MRVRFGDHVFDDAARQLTRRGEVLPVSPKAFALLGVLLEHRPRVVSRAALQDRLWPKTFVAYTSLARVVSELRRTLGDDRRRPGFIRTVPGFGYAFCAEAVDLSARPPAGFPCSLLWQNRVIGLAEGENIVGRGHDCSVRIDSPRISRVHARILIRGAHASIEDLESKNGTFVDGRRLVEPAALSDGVAIAVGDATLIFRTGYALASTI